MAEAEASPVPVWVHERAGRAVHRLTGEYLLLSCGEHRQAWTQLLSEFPVLLPGYPAEQTERLSRSLHVLAGLATDLPAWIDRLVPGRLCFESAGAGSADPALVVPSEPPAGCGRADWEVVRRFLLAEHRSGPRGLRLHLALQWQGVQRWSPSQRRAFLSGLRFQRLLSKLSGLADLRRHLAFQDVRWSQEWRARFAPFGVEEPGPAGGGPRVRPTRVPRHLAAWLLRREGVGSQASGYLLACFGLAETDWTLPRKDAARRLNTLVGRSLAFWRRLEKARLAQGGDAAHQTQCDGLGPAPDLLLRHFFWHVWDRVTPITGVRQGRAEAGSVGPASWPPDEEPLEYIIVHPEKDELARFLERLAARNGQDLDLEPGDEPAGRFGETLLRSGAPHPAPCAPSGAVDAAAWVLAEMPTWMTRVRGGVLDPVARGWSPPDFGKLVPGRPPPGLEACQWEPARELLLEPEGGYEEVFARRLAVARGWFGSLDDAPKPLTMLMQTALAYRDLVLTARDDALGELLELELEQQWNRAWRAVYWPAGLVGRRSVRVSTATRSRTTAHLQLAAWLLRAGGFSRSLIGGLLVHLGGASPEIGKKARHLARDIEKPGSTTEDLLGLLRSVAKGPLHVWSTLDRARATVEKEWQEQGRAAVEALFTTLQDVWLVDSLQVQPSRAGGADG